MPFNKSLVPPTMLELITHMQRDPVIIVTYLGDDVPFEDQIGLGFKISFHFDMDPTKEPIFYDMFLNDDTIIVHKSTKLN